MRSCLIVGGAPTNHRGLDTILERCTLSAVYAADAGYAALVDREIQPQAVFGDFDSLGYVPTARENAEQEVTGLADTAMFVGTYDPHKDYTDMDLAIDHAIGEGFTNIVLCDGLDARLDHSLANLQLMARAARYGQRVWGVTENEVVLSLDAQGGLSEVAVDEGAWGTCSVLAHSDLVEGVFEEGMEYSLTGAKLFNTTPLGISNELQDAPVRISIRNGSVWVFLPLAELARISYAGERLV